jgi:hypothetical protein
VKRPLTPIDWILAGVVVALVAVQLASRDDPAAPSPAERESATDVESTPQLIGFGEDDVRALVREQMGLPATPAAKSLPPSGKGIIRAVSAPGVFTIETSTGVYDVALASVVAPAEADVEAAMSRLRVLLFEREVVFVKTGTLDANGRVEIDAWIDVMGEPTSLAERLIADGLVGQSGHAGG